jgi:hypothetical protein
VYTLLSHGTVCERCAGGRLWQVAIRRCSDGRLGPSAALALESMFHHWVLKSQRQVDLFLAPSRFLRDKVVGMGLTGRVRVLPNFVALDRWRPAPLPAEPVIAYAGRLSPEKGLRVLLRAAEAFPFRLRVFGDGPERPQLEQDARARGLTNVDFAGQLPGAALRGALRDCTALVLPAIWYENNPHAVLEAYALGRPVIATDIGGLPEIVMHGETGLLVPPNEPGRLRDAMRLILADQSARPSAIVRHAARHVPHYRELFARHGLDPERVRGVEDLAAIPITTRDDVQASPPVAMVAEGIDLARLLVTRTAGSSARPIHIRRTWLEERILVAFRLRALHELGFGATDRRASLALRDAPREALHLEGKAEQPPRRPCPDARPPALRRREQVGIARAQEPRPLVKRPRDGGPVRGAHPRVTIARAEAGRVERALRADAPQDPVRGHDWHRDRRPRGAARSEPAAAREIDPRGVKLRAEPVAPVRLARHGQPREGAAVGAAGIETGLGEEPAIPGHRGPRVAKEPRELGLRDSGPSTLRRRQRNDGPGQGERV